MSYLASFAWPLLINSTVIPEAYLLTCLRFSTFFPLILYPGKSGSSGGHLRLSFLSFTLPLPVLMKSPGLPGTFFLPAKGRSSREEKSKVIKCPRMKIVLPCVFQFRFIAKMSTSPSYFYAPSCLKVNKGGPRILSAPSSLPSLINIPELPDIYLPVCVFLFFSSYVQEILLCSSFFMPFLSIKKDAYLFSSSLYSSPLLIKGSKLPVTDILTCLPLHLTSKKPLCFTFFDLF